MGLFGQVVGEVVDLVAGPVPSAKPCDARPTRTPSERALALLTLASCRASPDRGTGATLRGLATGGGSPDLGSPGGLATATLPGGGVALGAPSFVRAGSLLDEVGAMLDRPDAERPDGSLAMGVLALAERFEDAGLGETFMAWVGHAANPSIDPDALDRAIGPDLVDDLAREEGATRDAVLADLAAGLPRAVDSLTPDGTLPPPP